MWRILFEPLSHRPNSSSFVRFSAVPHSQQFCTTGRGLIELLYACEKVIELLEDPAITDQQVRSDVVPKAGRGVGCVEAPRGTLIHDYSTDENGFITRTNLIVGTTHNLAPINMSVNRVARDVIKNGQVTGEALNRIEMAVRAYDP